MTRAGAILRAFGSEIEAAHYLVVADTPVDGIVQKISKMDIPGKAHFESYIRHKWRMNHKASTLWGSYQAVRTFLAF
ncbi:MAG TPA: hypothetical protein VMU21_03550, partial [Thermodesulfovibrionales bacterium]|nr:hypothetical protein [Thermodesulfovibrionales bacterium]